MLVREYGLAIYSGLHSNQRTTVKLRFYDRIHNWELLVTCKIFFIRERAFNFWVVFPPRDWSTQRQTSNRCQSVIETTPISMKLITQFIYRMCLRNLHRIRQSFTKIWAFPSNQKISEVPSSIYREYSSQFSNRRELIARINKYNCSGSPALKSQKYGVRSVI